LKFLNVCTKIKKIDCPFKAIEENSTNDEAKILSEQVSSKMEEPMPDLKEKLPKANIWKLPEVIYGKNPEVPAFSSAVKLVHSKELGRHLFANRKINTGTIFIYQFNLSFIYVAISL
jgi:hypothetical protein